MPSTTKAQVFAQPGGDGLLPATPSNLTGEKKRTEHWHAKLRRMRRHPTIKLARLLFSAPILSASWSYEAGEDAPDGALELIQENMDPLRLRFLDHTVRGWMDYGWAPFEKCFEFDASATRIKLDKLKPLLQPETEILVDEGTGSYRGLMNYGSPVAPELTLTLSNEVEGTYWYGTPMMEASEDAFDSWESVQVAADRYDKRIAGSHWVIYYPTGESEFNGVVMNNYEIAKSLLNRLEASGRIVVPRVIDEMMIQLQAGATMKESSWSIDLLSDNGTASTSFVERMKYLDALMVRGFGLPERSVLEGQFGTKAEAGEHGDAAIINMEVKHASVAEQLNDHATDQLLVMHYGEESRGTVRVQPSPIQDEAKAYLRSVYTSIITNPEGFLVELGRIDLDAMKERLGIPIDETGEDDLESLLNPRGSDDDPFEEEEEPEENPETDDVTD